MFLLSIERSDKRCSRSQTEVKEHSGEGRYCLFCSISQTSKNEIKKKKLEKKGMKFIEHPVYSVPLKTNQPAKNPANCLVVSIPGEKPLEWRPPVLETCSGRLDASDLVTSSWLESFALLGKWVTRRGSSGASLCRVFDKQWQQASIPVTGSTPSTL